MRPDKGILIQVRNSLRMLNTLVIRFSTALTEMPQIFATSSYLKPSTLIKTNTDLVYSEVSQVPVEYQFVFREYLGFKAFL